MTKLGFRPTIAYRGAAESRAAAMEQAEDGNAYEEDISPPNYDEEIKILWEEISGFIQSFSGEKHDSGSIIAMLQNLSPLS